MLRAMSLVGCLLLMAAAPLAANDLTASLQTGTVELKSAGPIAFAPEGILLVGDTQAAAIYAIATGETSGNPQAAQYRVDGLDSKVAAALGTTPREILINDLAVNPLSGNAYLSVSRGRGPDAVTVLLKVEPSGQLSEVSLKNVRFAKAELPNPPDPSARDRRNQPVRAEAITDLKYFDGRVLVAGLSSEEFASTLRSIPFPFESVDRGTSVEIYHGNHGAFETRSPVRTFATYEISNQPHLLAAYTCTPLVKFPLSALQPGEKVRGTTVAELGNRNRPLDMIVYQKGGQDYILMANSERGVMKITTEGLDTAEGIEERIAGVAGQKYETLELSGVEQLDRLNEQMALIVQRSEDGALSLRTIALP